MPSPSEAHSSRENAPDNSYLFRRAFVRVMTVQVIALLALWWLQSTYAR